MSSKASVGTVIENKYRLEKELGSGGMGSVWLATQLMVDRPVAVKLLHPSHLDQQDLQARFEVEAKAIGRLNHPNVITLFDFGFSEKLGAFYTVIEYVDGVSLDKKLDQRLALKDIVPIIRQISLALDHAHHHGILHRDLKPENVMLARMTDGSEMVKVLDFGIARMVKGQHEEQESPKESHRITKAGEVFGTPAYMSPEQARSIRQLTPAADLYSLGVMFYELVAGGLPFFAQSAFDLLMMHVTKPVPPIRRPNVPVELSDVILRLLEKDPARRFQSGREVALALDAVPLPDERDEFDAGPTEIRSPTGERAAPDPVKVPAFGVVSRKRIGSAAGRDVRAESVTPTILTPPPTRVPPGARPLATPLPDQSTEHMRPTLMLDERAAGLEMSTGSFAAAQSQSRRNVYLVTAGALLLLALGLVGFLWVVTNDNATKPAAASEAAPPEPEIVVESIEQPPLPEEAVAEEKDIAAALERPGKPHVLPEEDQPAAKTVTPPPSEPAAVEDEPEPEPERRPKRRVQRKQRKSTKKPAFKRVGIGEEEKSDGPVFNRVRLD